MTMFKTLLWAVALDFYFVGAVCAQEALPELEDPPVPAEVETASLPEQEATGPEAPDQEPVRASGEVPEVCLGHSEPGWVILVRAASENFAVENAELRFGEAPAVATDAEGYTPFVPGSQATRVVISAPDFERRTISLPSTDRCQLREVTLRLTLMVADEAVLEVEAEAGSAEAVLEERRRSSRVEDGISGEEIRRSSDSDASQAARRIVGATIVGGQYLYVRGLGGRYVNVLLNGAPLPSTDPDQPGVQLDLFPSSMLESLNLAKTFSPDLPGDSAGGALRLSTSTYPTRLTLSMSGSLGMNTESTFSQAPMGSAGSLDALGFDDGSRSMPIGAPRSRPLSVSSDLALDEAVARSRTFRPTFSLRNDTVGPAGRLGFQVGNAISIGDARGGYFLNVVYSNSSQVLRGERLSRVYLADPATGELGTIPERQRTSFNNSVQLGALGSARLRFSDSELGATVLATQASDSYAGVLSGYDQDNDVDTRQTRSRWVERNLLFGQLTGRHRGLPLSAEFEWNLNFSGGGRSEPDTRDLLYVANVGSDDYYWRNAPGSGERLFLGLTQREISGGGGLTIPVGEGSRIQFGGFFRSGERDFSLRRFFYVAGRDFDGTDASLPPDELFAPSNLDANLYVRETTGARDSYFAYQGLGAGYAMADLAITSELRVVAGARLEGFRQQVRSRSPFSDQGASAETLRTDVDVMPAISGVLALNSEMNLRVGYGGTVARPQVRELAPFLYPDFVRLRNIFGNPNLSRTWIHAADIRWEWFLGSSEVIALTAFGKLFENPIEMVAFENSTFSFDNAQGAVNLGLEAEVRVGLDRITDALEGFEAGANLTLVYSQVTLSEAQRAQTTSLQRPLAGQSPYVANVQLNYRVPGTSFAIRALYNVFGERILEVGREQLPDVIQEAFHSLDITLSLGLPDNFEVRASVENVFLDDVHLTQNGHTVQQYNAGLSASVGLSWRATP